MTIFSEKSALILLFFNVSFVVLAVCENNDKVNTDKSNPGAESNMWFGPRLGKRSLALNSDKDRQMFFRLLEAAEAVKYYYDQLPYYEMQANEPETAVSKKVIFTPKLGRDLDQVYEEKRYDTVDFTPRLGRRFTDDFSVTPQDQETFRREPELVDSRSRYFSPRLGRTTNYTPRLGRDLMYALYPEKLRRARSVNKTKSA